MRSRSVLKANLKPSNQTSLGYHTHCFEERDTMGMALGISGMGHGGGFVPGGGGGGGGVSYGYGNSFGFSSSGRHGDRLRYTPSNAAGFKFRKASAGSDRYKRHCNKWAPCCFHPGQEICVCPFHFSFSSGTPRPRRPQNANRTCLHAPGSFSMACAGTGAPRHVEVTLH